MSIFTFIFMCLLRAASPASFRPGHPARGSELSCSEARKSYRARYAKIRLRLWPTRPIPTIRLAISDSSPRSFLQTLLRLFPLSKTNARRLVGRCNQQEAGQIQNGNSLQVLVAV